FRWCIAVGARVRHSHIHRCGLETGAGPASAVAVAESIAVDASSHRLATGPSDLVCCGMGGSRLGAVDHDRDRRCGRPDMGTSTARRLNVAPALAALTAY